METTTRRLGIAGLAFAAGLAYVANYGSAWVEQHRLGQLIDEAPVREYVAKGNEHLEDVMANTFPIGDPEFEEVDKLHSYADWSNIYSFNVWSNRVREENPGFNESHFDKPWTCSDHWQETQAPILGGEFSSCNSRIPLEKGETLRVPNRD